MGGSAQDESVVIIGRRTSDSGMGSKLGQDVKSRTFGERGIEAMEAYRRLSVG